MSGRTTLPPANILANPPLRSFGTELLSEAWFTVVVSENFSGSLMMNILKMVILKRI